MMTDMAGKGPAIVWRGPVDADLAVVLDPAGEASHGELPATWRPLTDRLRIGWVRLPADGPGLAALNSILSETPGRRVHIVTSGTATEPVLWVAGAQARKVKSFVAIDPESCAPDSTWGEWARGLEDEGAVVRCFQTAQEDVDLRRPPPAPLGLPEVVGWVAETIAATEPPSSRMRDTLARGLRVLRRRHAADAVRARRTTASRTPPP